MAKLTDLWVNIGAKIDNFEKGTAKVKKDIVGLGSSVTKLGTVIAGAFTISAISAFIGECSRLAIGVDEITTAFKRLNDPTLLNSLRRATSNTVSDVNLMKSAVRAGSFGIPVRDLATYFEFAERKAGELGVATEQVIDAIVTGIGNKAPRSFKQLGISTIEVQKAFKDLNTELLTVEQVNALALPMIISKLEEMGANVESVTDKIDAQAKAWENLKTQLGGYINVIKGGLAEGILRFVDIFAKGQGTISNPVLQSTIDRENKTNSEIEKLLNKRKKDEAERAASVVVWEQKMIKLEEDKKKAVEKTNQAYKDLSKTMENMPGSIYQAPGINPGEQPSGDETPVNPFSVDSPFENYDITGPQIIATNEKVAESFKYASYSAEQFADALMGLGVYADSMEDFGKAAINAARQFVAAKLAEVVAQQIQNAVKSSGGNPYVALILGAAIGGATAAMFNSIVPKFGEGGVVNGPTLAMVGEKGPEAIIPLNKMGGTRITGELQLRGRDLYWSLKNYNDHLNRTT